MSVDEVLAIDERRPTIVVEGYLLLGSRGCTLNECPDLSGNCKICEGEIRLSASPTSHKSTIRLTSSRPDAFRCLSSHGHDTCAALGVKGQHVLVRASLYYSERDIERVALKDPEICELAR